MCVVSMVSDHFHNQWNQTPYTPNTKLFFTWEQWLEYQELKRKAAEIDAALGTPDCVDPVKEEWEKKAVEWLEKNARHGAKLTLGPT